MKGINVLNLKSMGEWYLNMFDLKGIDEIIMVGFFYGKKNEYFGVCIIVSVCFFYFLIKKYFIDFWEKKKYKLML